MGRCPQRCHPHQRCHTHPQTGWCHTASSLHRMAPAPMRQRQWCGIYQHRMLVQSRHSRHSRHRMATAPMRLRQHQSHLHQGCHPHQHRMQIYTIASQQAAATSGIAPTSAPSVHHRIHKNGIHQSSGVFHRSLSPSRCKGKDAQKAAAVSTSSKRRILLINGRTKARTQILGNEYS